MGRLPKILATITVAVGFLSAGEVNGAQAKCYNWTEARSIIVRHGLRPVQEISRALRQHGEKPIRLNLCKTGNEFYYVMSLLGPKGHVRNIRVNARARTSRGARPGTLPDSILASPIPSPNRSRIKRRRRPSSYRRFLPGFMR